MYAASRNNIDVSIFDNGAVGYPASEMVFIASHMLKFTVAFAPAAYFPSAPSSDGRLDLLHATCTSVPTCIWGPNSHNTPPQGSFLYQHGVPTHRLHKSRGHGSRKTFLTGRGYIGCLSRSPGGCLGVIPTGHDHVKGLESLPMAKDPVYPAWLSSDCEDVRCARSQAEERAPVGS